MVLSVVHSSVPHHSTACCPSHRYRPSSLTLLQARERQAAYAASQRQGRSQVL